jgi:ABC-2 type transport system ATP-binding protein
MPDQNVIIHAQGLTKRYGDFTALEDLNLDVQRGEIFGYLGPNGAGKTTTIRTMLDIMRPSEGHVELFGLDSHQHSIAINARVGFLPSEMGLYQGMKARRYFRFVEQARGVACMDEVERLADILDFNLDHSLSGLSTGNKRKVGLIQAMMHKPDLLILDEPTSGLDPLMQQKFNELVLQARDEGRTIFLSSHNLTEVQALCDRVGILRKGQLRAVENVDDLMNLSFRWVHIDFAEKHIDAEAFRRLEGADKLSVTDGNIRLQLTGNMDALIKLAAQYTVEDIRIQSPSLEEIFLKFYGNGQDAADNFETNERPVKAQNARKKVA